MGDLRNASMYDYIFGQIIRVSRKFLHVDNPYQAL